MELLCKDQNASNNFFVFSPSQKYFISLFISTFSVLFIRALCPLLVVLLSRFAEAQAQGDGGLWLLCLYEHAAWVLQWLLSGGYLQVPLPSSRLKWMFYTTVTYTMSCSRRGDFCNRKMCAFIILNDWDCRTLSCVEMLLSQVSLSFLPLLLKEGWVLSYLG